MKEAKTNNIIIEGYLMLLENLSPGSKLDIIARLTASVKSDIVAKGTTFQKAFGAFDSEKSADEIIDDIRESRTFTRQIEEF